jgi:chromosome segregation ATPase
MIEVAEAINSFLPGKQEAYSHVPPSEEPVFILTSGQLQEIISLAITQALEERQEAQTGQEKLQEIVEAQVQEIQALKSILQAQAERLETLEKLEELYHGKAPTQEERPILREVYQKRRKTQEELPSRVWSMEEDLQSLEQEVQSLRGREGERPQAQGGRKTEARIKEVKRILKASGGSRTFQELERALGLSPSQFSKLLNHLDKRIFEVSRRPGGKRGEKVLGLRVRIMEL